MNPSPTLTANTDLIGLPLSSLPPNQAMIYTFTNSLYPINSNAAAANNAALAQAFPSFQTGGNPLSHLSAHHHMESSISAAHPSQRISDQAAALGYRYSNDQNTAPLFQLMASNNNTQDRIIHFPFSGLVSPPLQQLSLMTTHNNPNNSISSTSYNNHNNTSNNNHNHNHNNNNNIADSVSSSINARQHRVPRQKPQKRVCLFYLKNKCLKGFQCGFRHPKNETNRGLNDGQSSRMKICFEFEQSGQCVRAERCRYLHGNLPAPIALGVINNRKDLVDASSRDESMSSTPSPPISTTAGDGVSMSLPAEIPGDFIRLEDDVRKIRLPLLIQKESMHCDTIFVVDEYQADDIIRGFFLQWASRYVTITALQVSTPSSLLFISLFDHRSSLIICLNNWAELPPSFLELLRRDDIIKLVNNRQKTINALQQQFTNTSIITNAFLDVDSLFHFFYSQNDLVALAATHLKVHSEKLSIPARVDGNSINTKALASLATESHLLLSFAKLMIYKLNPSSAPSSDTSASSTS